MAAPENRAAEFSNTPSKLRITSECVSHKAYSIFRNKKDLIPISKSFETSL